MPTAALKFLPVLLMLAPAIAAAQQTGASAVRTTMAVSLMVADSVAAKTFEGERFISGKGASVEPCTDCAAAPRPRLVAKGAANSGFRPTGPGQKVR